MLITDGGVAELVDALDSKSCFLWKYEFKSHHPYQSQKPDVKIRFLFFQATSSKITKHVVFSVPPSFYHESHPD